MKELGERPLGTVMKCFLTSIMQYIPALCQVLYFFCHLFGYLLTCFLQVTVISIALTLGIDFLAKQPISPMIILGIVSAVIS